MPKNSILCYTTFQLESCSSFPKDISNPTPHGNSNGAS